MLGFERLIAVLSALPFPVAALDIDDLVVVEFYAEIDFGKCRITAGIARQSEHRLTHDFGFRLLRRELFAECRLGFGAIHCLAADFARYDRVAGGVAE